LGEGYGRNFEIAGNNPFGKRAFLVDFPAAKAAGTYRVSSKVLNGFIVKMWTKRNDGSSCHYRKFQPNAGYVPAALAAGKYPQI
jgi:hypothetical protein